MQQQSYQDSRPKDYSVNEITLKPVQSDPIDIRDLVLELNIHEDIFNNTTYGDLVILDAYNRIANLPIFGFETLIIDFDTPNKEGYRKTFRVYAITDRSNFKEKSMIYIIRFSSQEQITSSYTKVTKSYNGKQISDIVSDIHNNYLESNKILDLEETKFLHSIVVPNWSPLKTINWLALRANSSKFNGCNFLYFEDKFGFNFQSIENLIDTNPSGIEFVDQILNIRLPYDVSSPHRERDFESDLVTIESYKFLEHIKVLENIDRGMYGSSLTTFDILQKDWDKFTFDYKDNFNSIKHLEPNSVKNDKRSGKSFLMSNSDDVDYSDSMVKLYPSCSLVDYPNMVSEWLSKRISQMQELQNVKIHLNVPGNTQITVGQTAKFTIYSPEPPSDKIQPLDPFYSGTYLITSVRHSIADKKYMTSLELIKDSVFSSLP